MITKKDLIQVAELMNNNKIESFIIREKDVDKIKIDDISLTILLKNGTYIKHHI